MQYCVNCVYPANHPLGITFNEHGICSGCLVHQEKYSAIEWERREVNLTSLLQHYSGKGNGYYDCVIPVTGSGDDFFVVNQIKHRYGLNPLLVTYNRHFNTKVGVRNLAKLISSTDCDHVHSTVGPDTIKKIVRNTLNLIGDDYWHVMAGSLTFPVQVATKFGIPLIIWGAHGWSDQVGQYSHFNMVEMTKKVRKEHGLRMLDAEDLLSKATDLTEADMIPFIYPSDSQLEKSGVRGVYLDNYFFWDAKKNAEDAIQNFNFETIKQERTYNTYESSHCHNDAGVHDYLKFIKFGYGKVSDHVSRDIRLNRLSRQNGIALVAKYQNVRPTKMHTFFDWLEISEEEVIRMVDKFRDPQIWKKQKDGNWLLLDSIANQQDKIVFVDETTLNPTTNFYQQTSLIEPESDQYVLTGRHYTDKRNFKAIEG